MWLSESSSELLKATCPYGAVQLHSDISELEWDVQLSWEGVGVAVRLKLLNISLLVRVSIFHTFSIVIGRIQNEF